MQPDHQGLALPEGIVRGRRNIRGGDSFPFPKSDCVRERTNRHVTGITGQDGAYLAELLLSKGYKVHGAYRRTASTDFWRIHELGIGRHPDLHLVEHDLTDLASSIRLLQKTGAAEVYNLAAQVLSPCRRSADDDFGDHRARPSIAGGDPLSIRNPFLSNTGNVRQVQAIPQTSRPVLSPQLTAWLHAHWMTINYRESYDIFGCSGILFNHESPLRGLEFVTRKITDGMAKIRLGKLDVLELGNLDAKRDWGYAKEYVEGMWRMLQAAKPDTYVLATNRSETVREFVSMAGKAAGFDLVFEGQGRDELGIDRKTGKTLVKVNPKFYRPAEVDLLIGNPEKVKHELGWEPKTALEQLCQMMVKADLRRNKKCVSF
jgi:GDPmannose 4,6-dehydratase